MIMLMMTRVPPTVTTAKVQLNCIQEVQSVSGKYSESAAVHLM